MSKAKGAKGERELLKNLWERGWATIRSAGSGSMRFPSPDLLAGKGKRILAIECKLTKKDYKYLDRDKILELRDFAETFGAEPFIAIRFKRQEWYLVDPKHLDETKKSCLVTKEIGKRFGIRVDEL